MKKWRIGVIVCAVFLTQAVLRVHAQEGKIVPYVPTPQEVVDRMLGMAGVGGGDSVIDLGSGDGRIVIAAANGPMDRSRHI